MMREIVAEVGNVNADIASVASKPYAFCGYYQTTETVGSLDRKLTAEGLSIDSAVMM